MARLRRITHVTLGVRPEFLATIQAAAKTRHMSMQSFITAVLRDQLAQTAARNGAPHVCCPCQDRRPTGEGRCCQCEMWSGDRARRIAGRGYALVLAHSRPAVRGAP